MKIKLFFIFLTTIITCASFNIYAQFPGRIDSTFNQTDKGFGYGDGLNGNVWSNAIQNDGKIIIAGEFTTYNSTSINRIARLNADESLDTTFNIGTGTNGLVNSISIQKDGRIIIGGGFTSYNGISRNHIARLNSDGTLDLTFNTGTGANSTVNTVAVQNDGKIIIGGDFAAYNGTQRNYIARLNTDGTLDNTLNIGTGTDQTVYTSAIQSDGKIIIGGAFTSYDGIGRNHIIRLNADGTLDVTFTIGTGANNSIFTIGVQNDGKIILGGYLNSYNGIASNHIARLNSDGSLDGTFNVGIGTNDVVETTIVQSNGKIIIGGFFTSYNGDSLNNIARLNSDGTLDGSFISGTGANGFVNNLSMQSNGEIIIGGGFTTYDGTTRIHIARLNSDGTLDGSFTQGTGTGASNDVYTASVQNDGKIIIGGNFSSYNGITKNHIIRLNTDGSIDGTFNMGTGANTSVVSSYIQNDGKILIGGSFSYYNGVDVLHIARLNNDGSLDGTFNVGTGTNNPVNAFAIQNDDKIIIGGSFTSYNGTAKNHIARMNADGTLDMPFNVGIGVKGSGIGVYIKTVAIQSDGKIVIGGSFTSYNGDSLNNIARLNTDGTLDMTFNIGMGTDYDVETILIQDDGKIIIGGAFSTYNGTARNGIARLNADGTLDSTFSVGTGINGGYYYVSTATIQNDGKIIIGGKFTSYNGNSRNNIIRLNTDGTLDKTFHIGTGSSGTINSTVIQNDGKIIIGGQFTSYNNTGRNRIARVVGGACIPPNIIGSSSASIICSGTSITLSGGGADIYTWSGNVTNGIGFVPTSTATYTVIGTNTVTTCQNTATVTVSVNPKPNVIANANISTVCAGFPVILNGGGANSYTWSGGVTNGVGFVPTATTTYTVTGVDANNCTNTATTTITVEPKPNVSANASATTVCTGTTITLTGAGATTYSWSGGITDGVGLIPNSTNTYTVVGTTMNGCKDTTAISIIVNDLPIVIANANTTTVCAGGIVTLTGGGASTYTWSGNVTNGIGFIPSATSTYTVIGADGNSCTNTAITTITVTSPTITLTASSTTICAGNAVTLIASGGTSYLWSNGNTNASIVISPTTNSSYSVTGATASGCNGTNSILINASYLSSQITKAICNGDSILLGGKYQKTAGLYNDTLHTLSGCDSVITTTLSVNPLPTISAGTSVPAGCNLSNGSIAVNVNGGTSPYTYNWLPSGGSTSAITAIGSGNYSITVSDAKSCSSSFSILLGDSCDYVWPGDANNDGVADNLDILTIGLGYGKTGATRNAPSVNWIGQPCSNWADVLTSGTNYKHIDCDGNGTINNSDTTAVVMNYGKIHNKKDSPQPHITDPVIYTAISSQTIGSGGSLVTVEIGFGTSSLPASNIYGTAFTLNFSNPSLVVPGSFSFKGKTSWMGTMTTDLMSTGFYNNGSSSVDVAMTKTNQQNASGFGIIATLQFRTSSSLTGTGNSAKLIIGVSNTTVIRNDETMISVNTLSDSVIVKDTMLITGISNFNSSSQISIVPNPTNGLFTIQSSENVSQIEITNVLGAKVYEQAIQAISQKGTANGGNPPDSLSDMTIDFSSQPQGIYFIHIKTTNGIVVKKIIKE